MDKFLQGLIYMLVKLFSVRFLVTLLLTVTVCWSFLKCFNLMLIGINGGNEKILVFTKEIFLFIGGALITAFSSAVTLYFTRQDRQKPDSQEETK